MFNSDLTANRPAAGIVGRIFIAIDSPYGIFRDTGTAWDQISSVGVAATTIYNGDGTLTGTRTVSSGGFQLVFNPQTTFFSSLTASTGASSFSVLGSNALSFAAGFSSSNIGNVYSANGAINAQNFLGNATFAQANLASAMVNVNKIDFGSGGHTITMTQSTAPGIRAMTGVQNQIQFTGSHNGTISHAAISQNLGFFRESGSTRTLTITNAYSLLINPLDDYGAGFTFTNRWGIYQAGASDKNYFAANVGIGIDSPTNNLDVNTTASGGGILLKQNAVTIGEFTRVGNNNRSRINLINGGITEITFDSGGLSFFRSNNLTIGATLDNGSRLQVYGDAYIKGTGATSATTGLTIQDNGGANMLRLLNDTTLKIGSQNIDIFPTANGTTISNAGRGLIISTGAGSQGTGALKVVGTSLDASGNNWSLWLSHSFGASSGTATHSGLLLNQTINQTGGANGITRGLYINPTLTAAADWRALEISAGISVLAPATTASATLRVPSGTAPTSPVDGDIWFNGTNLFMRIGGVTRTFTII
jgi:hypothetical protein